MAHFPWSARVQKSVLLVEFPSEESDSYSFALKRQGFSVSCARDGGEAIRECAVNHSDVVLINWAGSDQKDALQIASEMTLLLSKPGIVLVVPKGTVSPEAESIGVELFLERPYSVEKLVSTVWAVAELKPSGRFINV